MAVEQQALYLNYLRDTYGNNLQQAMFEGVSSGLHNPMLAQRIIHTAVTTKRVGLEYQTNPSFFEELKTFGGDIEYFRYALSVYNHLCDQILAQVNYS